MARQFTPAELRAAELPAAEAVDHGTKNMNQGQEKPGGSSKVVPVILNSTFTLMNDIE